VLLNTVQLLWFIWVDKPKVLIDHNNCLNQIEVNHAFHLKHGRVLEKLELLVPQVTVHLSELSLSPTFCQYLNLQISFSLWQSLQFLLLLVDGLEDFNRVGCNRNVLGFVHLFLILLVPIWSG